MTLLSPARQRGEIFAQIGCSTRHICDSGRTAKQPDIGAKYIPHLPLGDVYTFTDRTDDALAVLECLIICLYSPMLSNEG